MLAKKFRLLPREKFDVLVYDAEASHLLHHSIPEGAKTFWMETRSTIHIIPSFFFLVTFLKHVFRERAIGVARLFAIFDSLNCKVILTKTSVQPYLGRYAFLRPECLVIAIQATTRSSIGTKQKMQIAPSYYCFGQAEKDLFSIFEIPAKEIPIRPIPAKLKH